jgi:hypothetical protein
VYAWLCNGTGPDGLHRRGHYHEQCGTSYPDMLGSTPKCTAIRSTQFERIDTLSNRGPISLLHGWNALSAAPGNTPHCDIDLFRGNSFTHIPVPIPSLCLTVEICTGVQQFG